MRKQWNDYDINKIKKLVNKKSNGELSQIFNVSISSIEHTLNRYNIKREINKYVKKDITYIEIVRVNYLSTPCHECNSHQISPNGYPMKKVKGKKSAMSRYIYEEYNKTKIPKGYVIRHKCDNRLCINPNHLEIGKPTDNVRDSIERNRKPIGSLHPQSILDEKKVKKIKMELKNYKYGDLSKLSRKYKVSKNTIRFIYIGKIWKHVKIDD